MLSLSLILLIIGSALVLFNSVDFDFISKENNVKDAKQLKAGKLLLVLSVVFAAIYIFKNVL